MKKLSAGMIAATLMASAPVYAEDTYFNASYGFGMYSESGLPDANPNIIRLKAGKKIQDGLSFEGHLVLPGGDDEINYLGTDVAIRVKSGIAAYLRPEMTAENAKIYALVGVASGKLEAEAFGVTVSDSDSGISYGAGIELGSGPDLAITGEYIVYLSESDYDFTVVALGFTKYF